MKYAHHLADVHLRTHETRDLLVVKEEILVEKSECEMREGEVYLLSALRLAEQLGLPSRFCLAESVSQTFGPLKARSANALSYSVRFIIALQTDPRLVTS